jgi:ketosteroid isomerase-like protein
MEDDMSEANIRLVKDMYAAFGRGDIPAILDMLTPDVTCGMVGRASDVPMAGIRHGVAGAAEFFRLTHETQDLRTFEPQLFADAGEHVLVKGHSAWTMRSSGVSGENDWVHVFIVRNGKVAAFFGHQDTGLLAEAYHAATAEERAARTKAEANVARVREGYAAFGRGDVAALLATMADDVTWGMVGRESDVPMAGIRAGKAGVGEFFRSLVETQQITNFETRQFVADGDTVVVLGHVDWIMNRNGVAGGNDFVHVFTIRDGQVVAYRAHQDTGLLAEAYHAAPAVKRAANA